MTLCDQTKYFVIQCLSGASLLLHAVW